MAKLKRRFVNKASSARKFRKQVKQTKLPNLAQPMRGGFRM